MTPIVDVHRAPATTVSTDAYIMSPPVSVPGSASILSLSESRQLGSTSSTSPDRSSTVSSHLALATAVADY